MKLKKVLTIMLACMVALSSLVSFVGCSNEITEEMGNAAVSFVTTTSKALNQSGDVQSGVSEEVGDYYWKYYCSKTEPGSDTDSLEWSVFSDKNKALGLGTITNLLKGESYYFGLRGYSDSSYETLVWEGFHVDSDGNNAVVKLTSKNQLITVDVYTAGVGRLFFNFVAPAVNGFDASESYEVNGNVQYDYFTYKITSLDGNTTVTSDTNLVINDTDSSDGIYFNSSESMFYYANSTGLDLDTGTYLLTIWQNSYDLDDAKYKAVNQRKQVVIINIVSGVDTVVKGSLDSTALDTIDYVAYGYTESEKLHMQVNFNTPNTDEDVAPFAVTVTNASDEKKIIYNNDRIKVADGDYVKISWTTKTNMTLYVNGDPLVETIRESNEFTTTTNFYRRKDLSTSDSRNNTYVTAFDEYSVLAYGKGGLDYIITVQWYDGSNTDNDESISFTIVGIDESDGVTVGNTTTLTEAEIQTTTDTDITLTVITGQNITAEATVMKKIAQEILDETIGSGNKSSDTTDNEVDITLTILETDKTETSVTFDISMNADAKVYSGTKLVYSNSEEIESVSDYITTTMDIEKGLNVLHVYHSHNGTKYEMKNSSNTSDDVKYELSDGDFYPGVYQYNATSGELTIKTRSFSPFEVVHDPFEARIGDDFYGTAEAAFNDAEDGETVELVKNVTLDNSIIIDKNITLDLNGKNVSAVATGWKGASPTAQGLFYVKSGAKFTVNDSVGTGSIDANGNSNVYSAIVLTINNNNDETKNAELVVNGGTLKGYYYGAVTNGNRHNTKITINGGTLTCYDADGTSIYHPNKGSLTINGGTLKGYDGLAVKGGSDVVITGGNFIATGHFVTPESAATSGVNSVGSALYIEGNYGYGAKVYISGGTFTTTDANAPAVRILFNENPAAVLSITGGTFSSDPSAYVELGYKAEYHSNDTWKVIAESTGTESDPFLIYNKKDFQAITEKYDTYYYYKIADEYTETDLTGWVPVSLHGSFDGNGKSFTNLTDCLFRNVGYQLKNETITLKNFSATMNVSAPKQYGSAALIKNIFNGGTTTFDSVDVHGKIEGYWNLGSYYNYGTANYDDVGCDYTVNFVNCKSDATLICTSGNTCGGFLGHGYEGSNHTQTLNIDADSAYTGYIYTTGGNAGHYIAMNSTGRLVFNGVETSRYDAAFTSYDKNVKITIVTPVNGDNGFTVAAQNNVAKILVSVTAQLDGYESDNTTKIQNLSGITMTFGSSTITESLTGDGDVKVLDKVTSVTINNKASSYNHSISNGVMTLNIASDANYRSGTVRITVTQYDADNNILCCGTANVYSITNN